MMANGKFQQFMNRMFDPGPNVTERSVEQNRLMADSLLSGGPPQIQHPLQGLAHLANALNAQAFRQKAQRGESALEKQRLKQMGDMMQVLDLDPQQRAMFDQFTPEIQRQLMPQLAAGQLMPDPANQTTRQFREGDQFVTRRVVNGMPDMSEQGILARSPIDRVSRVEQGGPGAFADVPASEATAIRDQQTATMNVIDTGGDIIGLLNQAPDVNTFASGAARLVNNLQQEGVAIARTLGRDFDPNILDPSQYSETFDSLGVQNAQMRSLFTALAFQAAAAAGQEGRSVSDADIRRFLQQSGANERDPRAIAQVVSDLVTRTERGFRNSYKVRTGQDFEGDLGSLPGFEATTPNALDPEIEAIIQKYAR